MNGYIQKLVFAFVKYDIISKDDYESFAILTENVLHSLITTIICVIIGIQMNMILANIIFLFSFGALRNYIGGIHAKSHFSCLLSTMALCYICMYGTKYSSVKTSLLIYFLALLGFLYSFDAWNNNIINIRQKMRSKYYFRITLTILSVSAAIAFLTHSTIIFNSIIFSIGAVSILAVLKKIPKRPLSPATPILVPILSMLVTIILELGISEAGTLCARYAYQPKVTKPLQKFLDEK